MPIPKPTTNESQEAFVSRCHQMLASEFPDSDQRHAICMSSWREVHGDGVPSKSEEFAVDYPGHRPGLLSVPGGPWTTPAGIYAKLVNLVQTGEMLPEQAAQQLQDSLLREGFSPTIAVEVATEWLDFFFEIAPLGKSRISWDGLIL